MRETTAEVGAKADLPAARGPGEAWDVGNFPVLQTRFATALRARSRAFRILLSGYPDFRILMAGSSISMFGSRISTVAFPMLVLYLNHSPFFTGLVAFMAIAPGMLVYVPAGVLVDRWNPRRVMLVSEFLRGLAIASVVISLAIFGLHTSVWYLILAMLVEEILEIFSTLADRRYLSTLLKRDNLASRQAYIEVRTHAVVLAGRSVGPFLFALGPVLPFAADALSFLFSIASLRAIRRKDESVRAQRRLPPEQWASDITQGFSWLRQDPRARLTVTLMAVTSLVAQALIMMFLAEAHSRALSTIAIGVVLAASGAGGAIGALFSRFLPDKVGEFWLPIQMIVWSAAIASLAMAGGRSAFWSAVAMFALGFTGAIGNITFQTYLVASVTDDKIAKVTGVGQVLAIGACALGPVIGGFLIQRFGVQHAVLILLCVVLLLTIVSLRTPKVAAKIAAISRIFSHNQVSADLPVETSKSSVGRQGGDGGRELVSNGQMISRE
ncbi:MAG: MFS transporter [Trebonia sp.]